jgi:toxin ParE1/3/4
MARIIWTDPALSDIELICDYHADFSIAQSARIMERLFAATDRLALFPQSGHFVFDVPETPLREVFSGNYRILYSYVSHDDVCRIIAVIHGSQSLLKHLEDRDFEFTE